MLLSTEQSAIIVTITIVLFESFLKGGLFFIFSKDIIASYLVECYLMKFPDHSKLHPNSFIENSNMTTTMINELCWFLIDSTKGETTV
jgi:hypothetical protein